MYTLRIAEKHHASESVKAAIERLRVMVREAFHFKEQMRFLSFLDTIDQQVSKGEMQMDVIQGTLVRARSATRRSLNDKPIDMVKLLNGYDLLEEELMKALSEQG